MICRRVGVDPALSVPLMFTASEVTAPAASVIVRVHFLGLLLTSRDHADALSDLQGYLEQASSDPEFLASLRDALSPACAELAPSEDDRDAHPHIARVRDADFASLAASKKDELLYRIGDA